MKHPYHVGTSGWNYDHWKGSFYPEDWPKKRWLEYYVRHFDTVELNATFYRLPKEKTFANWCERTPGHFQWAVKASRYITHIKRLRDPEKSLEKFYRGVRALGDKLGPVLIQLPPKFSFDEERFAHFCSTLDRKMRYTVEVRDPSWINDAFFSMLRTHNIAFCIADTAGKFPYNESVTADFVYIRLHGSRTLYASNYTSKELKAWADKIQAWGKETYVYFDNDNKGYAAKNAAKLLKMLSS
jgi:uncharacterized protein YecE (DUF72 family)